MSGKGWELGQTSRQYETSGRGASTVSSGVDDPGGVSYGSYQMTSRTKTREGKVIVGGTVAAFLKSSSYGAEFEGLTPGTSEFSAKWKEVAGTDLSFAQEQHEYIKRTHYDRMVDRLLERGIDLSGRGPAVQDALWSTAVQYGPGSSVFIRGLDEKFGKAYELSDWSDKEIVDAVQSYKAGHVRELFPRVKRQSTIDSLESRALNEKADLMKLADQDHTVVKSADINPAEQIQRNLNTLKIPDAQGRQLVADGNAGPRTQQAIESFQRQHGIPVDGKATPQLLSATQIAVSVTEALSSSQQFSREYSAQPNTPPGWAGVPHAASTQTVHVPRSAERTASTERVAAAAQFDGVRVRVDSTEQLHPRQMARAPVATSVSELDRDAVVSLQRDLNRLGFTDPRGRPLAEDGHHGPNTQAAVSAFQREQGLPPTGMADPATLSAVNAHAIVANLQQQRDERETLAAFQAQARAFDAQQAAPRSPDHDPLGRETATLHEARSTQASGFGELRGTYLPPSGGSPAVDDVRSSGRVADALDHTAMRHVERGPHRLEAASNAVPSAEPASMRDARDPQHPDHAFYRAIADKLPGAYAEAGLSVPGREAQERVAASLSAQARSQGVVSADHVVVGGGEQGNIFVVQGRLDDPAHLRTHLPLQEAQSAPLQESFQQLQQASQPLARDQQAQHEHAQQRAQGAAMSM